jgi:hypothetical protein
VAILLSCALLGALLAPAGAPLPPSPTAPPAAAYGASEADADLERVLHERGRPYLEARARLEAAPALAAPAVAARLRRIPAPTAAEERRLLALLSGMARPEDLEMFATQLRRDVAASHKNSPGERDELRAAGPWRAILREQGAAAVPTLTALVGDRELGADLRALLLADLVAVTPPEQLAALVALVGGGALELRLALRVALARRALASPTDRAALLAAVDAGIASSEPPRKAALIGLRAGLGDGDDAAFTAQAIAWATDDTAAFVVRVAALRVLLARAAEAAVQACLNGLAAQHLDPVRRVEQASEVLGALALQGLSVAAARALVERHDLLVAAAPRIASAAYAAALLAADGSWLAASQAHPWPEVRSAALTRVEGPCAAPMVKKLAQIADATGRKGEAEAIVAREAIAALGRCGGDAARAALVRMLDDGDQDPERRAEAGRQLVKHHGSRGAAAVAAASQRTPDVGLAIRLVRALQRSEVPAGPEVREALCAASEAAETAAAARQAIGVLMAGEDAPCGERSGPERPDPEKPRVYPR